MSIFLVIKVFGVVVATASTPYTIDQCIESLEALSLPEELNATAECVEAATAPKIGTLTPEQQRLVDEWAMP